jgi:hypothetical protein
MPTASSSLTHRLESSAVPEHLRPGSSVPVEAQLTRRVSESHGSETVDGEEWARDEEATSATMGLRRWVMRQDRRRSSASVELQDGGLGEPCLEGWGGVTAACSGSLVSCVSGRTLRRPGSRDYLFPSKKPPILSPMPPRVRMAEHPFSCDGAIDVENRPALHARRNGDDVRELVRLTVPRPRAVAAPRLRAQPVARDQRRPTRRR